MTYCGAPLWTGKGHCPCCNRRGDELPFARCTNPNICCTAIRGGGEKSAEKVAQEPEGA